jgi:hypothetical protein
MACGTVLPRISWPRGGPACHPGVSWARAVTRRSATRTLGWTRCSKCTTAPTEGAGGHGRTPASRRGDHEERGRPAIRTARASLPRARHPGCGADHLLRPSQRPGGHRRGRAGLLRRRGDEAHGPQGPADVQRHGRRRVCRRRRGCLRAVCEVRGEAGGVSREPPPGRGGAGQGLEVDRPCGAWKPCWPWWTGSIP